jgi:hypothetical protein
MGEVFEASLIHENMCTVATGRILNVDGLVRMKRAGEGGPTRCDCREQEG